MLVCWTWFLFIYSFIDSWNLILLHVCQTLPLAVRSEDADTLDPKASDDAKALMMWVKSVLAKYWILLCCGSFLLVGLQNEVSVYQIGYMAIFLFILICYQVILVMLCRLLLITSSLLFNYDGVSGVRINILKKFWMAIRFTLK